MAFTLFHVYLCMFCFFCFISCIFFSFWRLTSFPRCSEMLSSWKGKSGKRWSLRTRGDDRKKRLWEAVVAWLLAILRRWEGRSKHGGWQKETWCIGYWIRNGLGIHVLRPMLFSLIVSSYFSIFVDGGWLEQYPQIHHVGQVYQRLCSRRDGFCMSLCMRQSCNIMFLFTIGGGGDLWHILSLFYADSIVCRALWKTTTKRKITKR